MSEALDSTLNEGSEALGFNVGENLLSNGIREIEAEFFLKGVLLAISRTAPTSSEEQRSAAIHNLIRKCKEVEASENLRLGQEFLAANALRNNVRVLESGLQYEILTGGTGSCPGPADEVTTHYHGTTIDGSVFDSSVQRNQPASFRLDQVIRGWTEALQLMNRGAKWRLFIPAHLAYGERGAGSIGSNATLIFDVELLSF